MEERTEVSREDVAAVVRRLEALKVAFEKYFVGLERRPPLNERTAIQKKVREFTRSSTQNTAIRYQLNRLKDTYLTYSNYWDRILRQIEDGTYTRELFKMKLKDPSAAKLPPPPAAGEPPGAAKPAPEAEGSTSAADDAALDKIYRSYVFAKKKCNESTDGITPEKIAATLRRQAEHIRSKLGEASVEFKVAIKDGKAVILAKTKKVGE